MDTRHASQPLTDLELLKIEAERSMDDRYRLSGTCGVKISSTRDGQLLFVGSEVPDTVVPALIDAVDRSSLAPAPDREPPALAACRAILEPACAPLSVDAGPTYLIEPHVRAERRTPIVRSDGFPRERLRHLNPGNWEPDEWDDLLDGALGPWAMAVAEGRVVSICHTPRSMTKQAAECGVWTHPDYRGRGYAAAVTATWADILRASGRCLFYCTDAQNFSSQRVAARLRLRLIGWTWNLARADPGQRDNRHPLSRRS
ncbi:MAG TPA: GNAT family N-acetyltransferase, partial [Chloroflexota bacterium]